MATFSCVVTIEVDDEHGYDHPAKWQWDELIGDGVRAVEVFDVTDEPINRVRLTADGAEEI